MVRITNLSIGMPGWRKLYTLEGSDMRWGEHGCQPERTLFADMSSKVITPW